MDFSKIISGVSKTIDSINSNINVLKDKFGTEFKRSCNINEEDEYRNEVYSNLSTLIHTSELHSILPRLKFTLDVVNTVPCLYAGLHSIEANADLYFTFKFLLALSGDLSMLLEMRYLHEGETNTKHSVRMLSLRELELLGISMEYSIEERQMTVRISDSLFIAEYTSNMECIKIDHYMAGNLVSMFSV